MSRLWRSKQGPVEFCERCGSVCDGECRRQAIVDRAVEKAVLHRVGFS